VTRDPVRYELRARHAVREQDRPDVAHDRRHWRVWQRYMDPARFVFLDETCGSTKCSAIWAVSSR
jgi:hypothetical protein